MMLQITDICLRNYFKWRQKKIELVYNNPQFSQQNILKRILLKNASCSYGKKYNFNALKNYPDYKSSVPLVSYEDIYEEINKMMLGENQILTTEKVNWFAKSSGTTNDRSKFIPVTKNYLINGHLKCAWDAASFIYNEDQEAKLFADKSLIMGGSIEKLNDNNYSGDISAIILHHFPKIGRRFYTPDFDTALMKDWDEKIKKMAQITAQQNVTLLAGVPSWTLVLLKEILKQTGKSHISEVWPNLKSYLHGGVGFQPYQEIFKELIPSKKVGFREVYNASEGYFGIQNNKDIKGILLLCDHEIFYEFIPFEDSSKSEPETLTIDQVELFKKYIVLITNSSGLYRYRMGDIIEFISLRPHKFNFIGREKQNINVVGEELMVHNTDMAISETASDFNVRIEDYTVAPHFISKIESGHHDWIIEFSKPPRDLKAFENELDLKIQNLNSDYSAKRSGNLILRNLKIHTVPQGTFEKWLRQKGKYGGQNKIPRLMNSRLILEEILKLNQSTDTLNY